MSKNKKNIFFSFIDKINFFKKNTNLKKKINKKSNSKKNNLSKKYLKTKQINIKKNNYISYFKNKFLKTKKRFNSIFKNIFLTKKIDKIFLKNLEEKLISCDISFKTTKKIINFSKKNLNKNNIHNPKEIYKCIIHKMELILNKNSKKKINLEKLSIILLVGVNGSGKTTTAVKLSKLYQNKNKKVLVAAADTFRAAAVDQIKILCKKNNVPIFFSNLKADPASVVYDAIKKAVLEDFDILIIDTSGRLHTKVNLMNEVKKIVKVIKKNNKKGKLEIFLTIDSCNGQNSLIQAQVFNQYICLTGLILTKFDGTSKGGIIFSISDEFSIPIRYITTGESINDICCFKSNEFIKTIFKT
ncbi:signal recognition particle-docking protein FtsY [Buchnera aphidicola]|uniref:signal recognition particle-docking protein FtsY n=1 Tax=Buchnera aphidicola TaxID=9 RepID=UPI0031B8A63A